MCSGWGRVAVVEAVLEVEYAEGGQRKSEAGGAWKHPFDGLCMYFVCVIGGEW